MAELLNLTHQNRKHFNKHFLSSVHSELRFSGLDIKRVLDNQVALETAMRTYGFTECRPIVQNNLSLQIESEQSKLSHQATPLGLLFVSQTPRREFYIQSEKIVSSDFAYEGFEKFLSQFETYHKVISPIIGLAESIPINKVGLRKINSIMIEPVLSFQDALSVFNPSLFNLARSGLLRKDSFKINEETAIFEQNNQVCVLRTALHNRGKNTLEAKLDFDFVSLSATNFELAFSQTLPSLNQLHFDLFMWAVNDEMIHLMEN